MAVMLNTTKKSTANLRICQFLALERSVSSRSGVTAAQHVEIRGWTDDFFSFALTDIVHQVAENLELRQYSRTPAIWQSNIRVQLLFGRSVLTKAG